MPGPSSRRSTDGFTLTELLIIAAMCAALAAIVGGVVSSARAIVQGDADMRLVEGQLYLARDAAMRDRLPTEIQFTEPNLMRIVRHTSPTQMTVISTAKLEHDAVFMLFPTLPDTPDGFGRARPLDFGRVMSLAFDADGRFTDADGTPVNGTVFLGQAGKTMSARAVTIAGKTATIRGYRWNGSNWKR